MELTGIGVSAGVAEGMVRIMRSAGDAAAFQDGDILVAKVTDPTMVSMMARAGAIVCEIGSMTSHPSIVSRELGIPCVVSATGAVTQLKNGQRVRVDGTAGTIEVLA